MSEKQDMFRDPKERRLVILKYVNDMYMGEFTALTQLMLRNNISKEEILLTMSEFYQDRYFKILDQFHGYVEDYDKLPIKEE